MNLLYKCLLVITVLLLISCRKNFLTQRPIEKNFKYYDKNFMLKNEKLKTNGFYYNIMSDKFGVDGVSIYRFYAKGKLKDISSVDSKIFVNDKYFDVCEIFGFYNIENDTLRFTEDAHYFKKVKEYKGYFKGDTLLLTDIKLNKYEPYLFIEDGKTLNTGVDPKRYPME